MKSQIIYQNEDETIRTYLHIKENGSAEIAQINDQNDTVDRTFLSEDEFNGLKDFIMNGFSKNKTIGL